MSIEFACPMCHRQYRLKDELAGKTAKCSCGHKMKVPPATVRPSTATAASAAKSLPSASDQAISSPTPSSVGPSPIRKSIPSVAAIRTAIPPPAPADELASLPDPDAWLKMDFESAAPVSTTTVRCPACDQIMSASALLCTKCGYDKRTGEKRHLTRVEPDEEQRKKKPRGKIGFAASLFRGTVCCFIAAMIGAVIWAVIAYFTHREFGIVAWALGGLTGAGMSIAHDDDDGTLAGIIAAFMSIVGIVVAKILIVAILIGVVIAGAAAELPRTLLAMSMVEEKLQARGLDPENADEKQLEAALEEAKKDVDKLSDAEVEAKLEQMAEEAKRKARESETIDEKRVRLAVHILQQKLRAQGTSIAEASIEQLALAKQESTQEVEALTSEQVKERLAAVTEDEVDEDDEMRVAGAEFELEEHQKAAANPQTVEGEKEADAEGNGAAAKVGAFAMLIGMLFTPIDGLFILFAVATAYKVGSGTMTD